MSPEQIKAGRKANGWTQTDLAIQMGRTPSTVQRWERGACKPTPSACQALRAAFKGMPRVVAPTLQELAVKRHETQQDLMGLVKPGNRMCENGSCKEPGSHWHVWERLDKPGKWDKQWLCLSCYVGAIGFKNKPALMLAMATRLYGKPLETTEMHVHSEERRAMREVATNGY